MRQTPTLLVLAGAATLSAAVPNTFTAGSPAKAADINANFATLDSAIQTKGSKIDLSNVQSAVLALQGSAASKSDLTALATKEKADSATLAKAIPAPVDISGKANTSWVRDTLKSKQDALGYTPANKAGETFTGDVSIEKTLTVTSMVSAGGFQTGGGIRGSKVTVDTLASGAIKSGAITFDVLTSTAVSGSSTLPGHYYSLNYVETGDGPTSFVHYYPNGFSGAKPTFGHLRAYNPAGKDKYNVLIIGGGNDANSLQWRVGGNTTYVVANSGNFKEMASNNGIVMNTGGTITGDLKIAGKLTTAPGGTPADYVFEPDYKLASLSEVEAYTKEHKHLPEVPSAKDMTENGVDMAAMNMVLLKKVEELTLHAIALQKDVEAQKTLLADQQEIIRQMKAFIEASSKD